MTALTQTEASITNTLITGPDGLVLYEVLTPSGMFGKRLTSISKQGVVIATIEWHKLGGTILRFEGREAVLDDMFPKSRSVSKSRTYVNRRGATLKWKSAQGKLYCMLPNSGVNIATHHRARFAPFRAKRSTLLVYDGGLGLMNELVVTWVVMEKLANERRKRATHSSGGI